MTRNKILYGVCGIGSGHTYRQLPIIKHFAKNSDIMIFAYGESLKTLDKNFKDNPAIQISEVAVPFIAGNKNGLDFEAATRHAENNCIDFNVINYTAMAKAEKFIGKPNLVITDYEPICAQYAYAYQAPLVTFDQQSKYLCGSFSQDLNGHCCKDETMRLSMFFPRAEARIASSFFQINKNPLSAYDIEIYAPILNDHILMLNRQPEQKNKEILVYFSSQQPFTQNMDEITSLFSKQRNVHFHLFDKNASENPTFKQHNITPYNHGDPSFIEVLKRANGLITTAGHSLLSEAMHLALPVYALPLPIYEQQMNAHVIHQNKFGLSEQTITNDGLNYFLSNIDSYTHNIKTDENVLLHDGNSNNIISRIEKFII